MNSWWGLAEHYVNTTVVNPANQNWWWGRVYLDGDFASCGNRKGVVGHEAGHVMGLAHEDAKGNVLMHSNIGNMTVKNPTADDITGINTLY